MPRFNDDSPYLDRDKPFVQFTQGQFTLAVCLILIGLTGSFLLGITVTRFESKAGTAGKTAEAPPSAPTPTKTAAATPSPPEKPAVPKPPAGSTSPAPTPASTTTTPKGTASQQNTTTVEIHPKSIDVPAPPPEGKEVKPASVIPPAQPRKVDTETADTPANKAASPAASPVTNVAAPTTPKPPTAPTPPVKPDAKQQQPAGSGAKTASKSDSPDSSHNASWTRGYAIQLVAFSSKEPRKAEEYKRRLEKNSDIRVELLNTQKHVRVMLGPFKDKTTVQKELTKLRERKGFADAFVQPLPLAD